MGQTSFLTYLIAIVLSQGDGSLRAYLLTAKTGDAFIGVHLREVVIHGQG
jgi:hypothetical protein